LPEAHEEVHISPDGKKRGRCGTKPNYPTLKERILAKELR
jgi:hypothetical protein